MTQPSNEKIELFRTADVMRAMLDNGYKSTDYAIAELIDNSIEAGAKHIDILVFQSTKLIKQRSRSRISKIAVVDDGVGMEPNLLSRVLTFGYGTHSQDYASLKTSTFGRMGKYGFGLPNASSSQSDVVHVYSWQNGIDSAYKTSLYVQRVVQGSETSQRLAVPEHVPVSLRRKLQEINHEFGRSGTIVLWDECATDRNTWKIATTLLSATERTCGRIFRKFIDCKQVVIRMALFNEDSDEAQEIRVFRANDPLFLMKNTIADSLLIEQKYTGDLPLFLPIPQGFPESRDFDVEVVNSNNEKEIAKVEIRVSMARINTLKKDLKSENPGGTKVGRLAADNSGVSVLRAGRELELSKTWVPSNSEPRHRWWGVEINFPPALDKIFGVTNNKQSAIKLEALANSSPDDILSNFKENWVLQHPEEKNRHFTYSQMLDSLKEIGDDDWVLYQATYLIQEAIRIQFNFIKNNLKDSGKTTGTDKEPDKENNKPATSTGLPGKTPDEASKEAFPEGPTVSTKEKEEQVINNIYPDNNAKDQELRKGQIERLREFIKSHPGGNFFVGLTDADSNAFFECRESDGLTAINFNTNHPAYERLLLEAANLVVEDEGLTLSAANVTERVDTLKVHILLMFLAWARTELKLTRSDRMVARAIKEDWGKNFLSLIDAFDKVTS